MNLKKKLIISYIFTASISILLISIMVNFFLEKQFKNYLIKNYEKKCKVVSENVANQYSKENGWNRQDLDRVGLNSIQDGFIIILKDKDGKVLWSTQGADNLRVERILRHISNRFEVRGSNLKSNYVEKEYELIKEDTFIGTAKIGFYSAYYFNEDENIFLNTLNKFIILVGIVSLIISIIFGVLMAKSISKPILKVIDSAYSISKGNYEEKISKSSEIDELGKLIGSINNLSDNLHRQEIIRKRLTEDISHELRTPVTTIQAHMEAFLDGIWEPTSERINDCYEETVRLHEIIGDLEILARYEGNNYELDKTNFNLRHLVLDIYNSNIEEVKNKGIQFNLDGEDFYIFADKIKLAKAISNILANSIKYTEAYGRIDVILRKEEKMVTMIFEDNGIGIAQKDLPYVFERFYRSDRSRNRITGGSGMGLSVVKSLVEAHGGYVDIFSQLGKGTIIKIVLATDI